MLAIPLSQHYIATFIVVLGTKQLSFVKKQVFVLYYMEIKCTSLRYSNN